VTSSTHFIGIGGIGMSALAHILLDRGEKVSGSDLKESYLTQRLDRLGASVFIGHDPSYCASAARVVYSTDVKADNCELKAAKERGCPLWHRSDLLCDLMQGQKVLAVAGSHGKTTTSALLTWVLSSCGYDPSFAVGGNLVNLQRNGGSGKGPYFVAEADESDGTFLKYPLFGAIVTNVTPEHLNYYGSEKSLHKAFEQFASAFSSNQALGSPGLIWCADDASLRQLKLPPAIRYGFEKGVEAQIVTWQQVGREVVYDLLFKDKLFEQLRIPLMGRHAVLNSAAVAVMALQLGVEEAALRRAFLSFQGAARRCEVKGRYESPDRCIEVIDDYAHHPKEVAATLAALRRAEPQKKLVVVFQPHRYTRLRDCFGDYVGAFDRADQLYLAPLYSAGESPIEGIHSQALSQAMALAPPVMEKKTLLEHLCHHLTGDCLVVTLGAGDITSWGPQLLERLRLFDEAKAKGERVG
jgi:UDP-N-acetylmuramate--alanine ligase